MINDEATPPGSAGASPYRAAFADPPGVLTCLEIFPRLDA